MNDVCEKHYELLFNALNDSKTKLPEDIDCEHKIIGLISNVYEIKKILMSIAAGDLRGEIALKGRMAGTIKALQANLRHLTWQTQAIAKGDLTQRIDFFGEFSTAFNTMVEQIAENRRQLVLLATTDVLTGVPNRRSFLERVEKIVIEHNNTGATLSTLMMDIDFFKKVNDNYGHEAGDIVLKKFAQLCLDALREQDVLGRLGGEEFAIILPNTTAEDAVLIAEHLRARVEQDDIYFENQKIGVTVSIGLATIIDNISLDEMLRKADSAMYRAKNNGRNRVEIYLGEK